MADDKDTEEPDEPYEVGYRKPPKSSRFKPGRSGNPKGRPKGTRNLKKDVRDILKSRVVVTRDGKPRKISTQEAMLWRLKEKALGGDLRALNQLIALAQTYDNEELPLRDDLSDDNAAILEIYNDRLLKGLIGPQTTTNTAGSESCDETNPDQGDADQPESESPPKKKKGRNKRYRLGQAGNDDRERKD